MFSNVLVGVDGQHGGRDAIALGRQLAAPDAVITLAHVFGSTLMLGRGGGLALSLEREESEKLLVRERAEAGLDAELVSCAEVPPARGLHELAERRGADLLVVGSSRHAALGRVVMGDDTLSALHGAPCAIAIAPRGYTDLPHRLTKLGVGYDGSPESEHALNAARELAARDNATIKALWVVSLRDVRDEKPIPADWSETAERLIKQCSRRLRELDAVEGEATYGGPREELTRFGKEVDLLMVGSRGYGPLGRLFHGSISGYLARHAPCPLLVLPRSATIKAEPDSTTDRTEKLGVT